LWTDGSYLLPTSKSHDDDAKKTRSNIKNPAPITFLWTDGQTDIWADGHFIPTVLGRLGVDLKREKDEEVNGQGRKKAGKGYPGPTWGGFLARQDVTVTVARTYRLQWSYTFTCSPEPAVVDNK